MARLNLDLVTGSAATVYNNGNLTTTPVKVLAGTASSAYAKARRWIITNASTAAFVAFRLCPTATSPVFVASGAGVIAATEGVKIWPGQQFFINVHSSQDLWLAASAGSTPVQAAPFDTEIK